MPRGRDKSKDVPAQRAVITRSKSKTLGTVKKDSNSMDSGGKGNPQEVNSSEESKSAKRRRLELEFGG